MLRDGLARTFANRVLLVARLVPVSVASTTAARDAAGLVEHHGADATRLFQRLALVTSTPLVAPKPSETVTDSGVASPSAHGQAMISTLTAVTSACASCGAGPSDTQMANVQMAMIITAGTKYRAILSAS